MDLNKRGQKPKNIANKRNLIFYQLSLIKFEIILAVTNLPL